ncbi:hypothetical protein DKU76_02585 [Salmonella enterica subsp. enterica serovar Napoli]|nr:hypothetical protein [Salmonella enterica subsp. enterica serovar Napoli]MLU44586.1 hypothetical protein [Salmonella enterica subsp. enterica serovar Napoli]
MRAAMKLATGVVPVALGVAMALMSGVAKAEEKAAQPQPLTGEVSAKTTQPSVGHRPTPPSSANYVYVRGPEVSSRDPSESNNLNIYNSKGEMNTYEGILMSGQSLHRIRMNSGDDVDDKQFLALDGYKITCKVYRVDNNGNEELIREAGCPISNNNQAGNEYIFSDEDVGKRIKIVYYAESAPHANNKYKTTPDKSLAGYSFITTKIAPRYRLADWPVTVSSHTIDVNNRSIRYDVYAHDIKGKPIAGYVGKDGNPAINVYATNDKSQANLFKTTFLGEFTPGVYSYEITAYSSTPTGPYLMGHSSLSNKSAKITLNLVR